MTNRERKRRRTTKKDRQNNDIVRELSFLKEGIYGRGIGALDMHVMLPSHMVEK
jgi:hypothetical protein